MVFARAVGSVAVIKLADRHEYDEPARETVIPGPRDGIDYACLSPCPFTPNSSSPMSRCAHIMKLCPQNYKRAIMEQAVLFELLASNAFLSLRTLTRYDCAWASRPYLPVVNLQIIV